MVGCSLTHPRQPPCLTTKHSIASLTEQNKDDGIAAQEHLADEAVLVDFATRLAVSQSGRFCPHLFRVLQNHVAVTVESLHAGEQLAVVSAGDEYLCARADSSLQDGKRTSRKLVFLDLGNLIFAADQVSTGDDSRGSCAIRTSTHASAWK